MNKIKKRINKHLKNNSTFGAIFNKLYSGVHLSMSNQSSNIRYNSHRKYKFKKFGPIDVL